MTRILGVDARGVQRLSQQLVDGLRDGRIETAIFYASDGRWPVPVTTGLCSCRLFCVLAGPCVHFLTQSLYIHVMYPGKFNPLPFDQFGRELCDDQLIVCQLVSVGAYACVCVMRVCVCVCEFLW